jgi:hypothetical protein
MQSTGTLELSGPIGRLRAKDPVRALEQLLEIWAGCRSRELAERIRGIAAVAERNAPKSLPPKHAIAVHRLVTTPVVKWMSELLEVAQKLQGAPPDPRIATWALGHLVGGGNNRTAEETFLAMVDRHGSAEIGAMLDSVKVKRPRVTRLEALKRKWGAEPEPALDDAARSALAALDQALDALSASDPKSLYLHAVEHPDDLASIQVLADHFSEQGDPRGEFIALQLLHERGGGDEKTRKAEASLWRKHWRAFYPELAAVLAPQSSRCRHGLLWRAGIHTPQGAPIAEVFSQPSFRSVREIDIHGDGFWSLREVPSFVEAVWGLSTHSFRWLPGAEDGATHFPWERVGLTHLFSGEHRNLLSCLPNAKVLAVEGYGDLIKDALPLVSRPLEVLCLGLGGLQNVEARLDELDAAPVGEVRVAATGVAAWDAPALVLRRQGSARLRVASGPEDLPPALDERR